MRAPMPSAARPTTSPHRCAPTAPPPRSSRPTCTRNGPAVAFVHCLLAIVGSLLAGASPLAGFVVVLFAAVSLFGDLSGRWYLVRSVLFFRRASQNVVSPPLPPEPASGDAEPRSRRG